ncbi:MAG: hypothetical protein OXD47_02720 [Gammaproteobacteria bacterium]|nr:hypothetical protein [Gammaproteobacteria bacterium]MCY4211201.1 hypothetical protein [Gammaproteobacteria bacterium]MCY4281897.1 hypothetical protein [Gammaproteobacteria bacterium]MCY4337692.1 hypothetical protein [Gammaproteobacteria bacterium]
MIPRAHHHYHSPKNVTNVRQQPPTISRQQRLGSLLQEARVAGKSIDQQGKLVGRSASSGIMGTVVSLMVKMGIAKEGKLMGRVATALVGKENFDLIRNQKELQKTSINNVLKLLEEIESKGLEPRAQAAVSRVINSEFNENTPISSMTGKDFDNLHKVIQDQVIPQATGQSRHD